MPCLDDGAALGAHDADASRGACLLPEGIVRTAESALAAKRLIADGACAKAAEGVGKVGAGKVKVAAFDFDGTIISGNSPVMLVRHLARLHMLRVSKIMCIILWAGAYKARLPQNESWVRGLVFSAFEGKPAAKVNEFLRAFYAESVAPRFRQEARAVMQSHLDAGHVVVCVSATFEPIVAAAMCEHPIQFGIATRMKTDGRGCYRAEVEGQPVEGEHKLTALTAFADARFGKGGWELAFAYGDHHSDRTLLKAAQTSFAVTPDRPLARTAREEGYEVLDWGE